MLLRHAFEALDCIAVEFRTHRLNTQSRRAIERLGAKLDGVLRSHQINRHPDAPNTLRDTCVYSITAAEWPTVKAHLTHLLAVEGIDYERLEVSSPGLDRPLRKAADFRRFAGQRAEVRMRERDAGGRRKYAGVLLGCEGDAVRLEVDGVPVELALDGMDRAHLLPDL